MPFKWQLCSGIVSRELIRKYRDINALKYRYTAKTIISLSSNGDNLSAVITNAMKISIKESLNLPCISRYSFYQDITITDGVSQ